MVAHAVERTFIMVDGTLYESLPSEGGYDDCELRNKSNKCNDCKIGGNCLSVFHGGSKRNVGYRYLKEVKA